MFVDVDSIDDEYPNLVKTSNAVANLLPIGFMVSFHTLSGGPPHPKIWCFNHPSDVW